MCLAPPAPPGVPRPAARLRLPENTRAMRRTAGRSLALVETVLAATASPAATSPALTADPTSIDFGSADIHPQNQNGPLTPGHAHQYEQRRGPRHLGPGARRPVFRRRQQRLGGPLGPPATPRGSAPPC